MDSPRGLGGNFLPVVSLPKAGRFYIGDDTRELTPPKKTRMVRVSVIAGAAWVSLTPIPTVPPIGDIEDDTFDVEYISEGERLEFQFTQGVGETKTFHIVTTGTASVAISYYGDISIIGRTIIILDADGTEHVASSIILDADATRYVVPTSVLDADGVGYEVI